MSLFLQLAASITTIVGMWLGSTERWGSVWRHLPFVSLYVSTSASRYARDRLSDGDYNTAATVTVLLTLKPSRSPLVPMAPSLINVRFGSAADSPGCHEARPLSEVDQT